MDAIPEEVLDEWVVVSQFLYWFVLLTAGLTLPLLLVSFISLRPYRHSQYFPFLAAILIGNFVMLSTIALTLIMEQNNIRLPGTALCKLTAFLTSVSACFTHWTWVAMYTQRGFFVFFPMRRRASIATGGPISRCLWDLLCDTRKLLVFVATLAAVTQTWTPILMTQNSVHVNDTQGTYCGQDATLNDSSIFQWIVIVESAFIFTLPFLLTIVTDMAVFLCRSGCNKHFTLVTVESLHVKHTAGSERSSLATAHSGDHDYIKIQSERSILSGQKRRHNAIRRCLLMATFQLSLNLPNYVLQLCDEFYELRLSESTADSLFYIKADAIAYVLYLLQFPLLPLYVHFFKYDMTSSQSKRHSKAIDIDHLPVAKRHSLLSSN